MGQKYIPTENARLRWPIKLSSSNPPDELHLKCRAGRMQYTRSWQPHCIKAQFDAGPSRWSDGSTASPSIRHELSSLFPSIFDTLICLYTDFVWLCLSHHTASLLMPWFALRTPQKLCVKLSFLLCVGQNFKHCTGVASLEPEFLLLSVSNCIKFPWAKLQMQ